MKKIIPTLAFAILLMCCFNLLTSCKKGDDPAKITTATVDSLKIGLVAYYPFNNSGADESGNGNNGWVNNITSANDRNGKANAAYHFDGVSSYVVVPDNQSLRLANTDITLNTWIKLDSYGSSFGYNILTKRTTGVNNGWAWGITGYGYTPTGVISYGPGGGNLLAQSTKAVTLNQWHMVTSIYQYATQKLSVYIDGVLNTVTSNMLAPNAAISADMYIGCDNPGVSTGYFLQGSLDDVRIYNRALPQNQLSALFILGK